ncbi:hypothetical protein GUJ93_ZPchr0002g23724 [Zizania palustris]|uniref:Uncharacterized protein n=1 Tax=Zizania palustris TaxID=103762 RepID=A0A8J5VCK0_ZIZPA|nr:hypothetical protein GUJ93_ZPchr0002g23724 [Zizania palustris]
MFVAAYNQSSNIAPMLMSTACAGRRSAKKMKSLELTQSISTEPYFLNSYRRRGSISGTECRSHSRLPKSGKVNGPGEMWHLLEEAL